MAMVAPLLHVVVQPALVHRATPALFHDVSYIGGRLLSVRWSGLGLSRVRLDVLPVQSRPGAVTDRAGEPGVEEGEETLTVAGGVPLHPDRVALRGHEPSDELRVRVELHQVPQDRLVRADRVDLTLLRRPEAGGIGGQRPGACGGGRLDDVP